MPIISDHWGDYFSWNGNGDIPLEEKKKLLSIISDVKKEGYVIRFWGTPNATKKQRRAIWTELLGARADLIGTDYLDEIKFFLH
ncbi:hypothetical protein SAMN06265379_101723 [Saccharicrinis carchari]|uniref:Uncharacterized protein n=2 Tax=Saccharicrinis carchari TaxID=1168039 RepID=A0A521B5L8_SACCC|nr:hypothetical protein SAMN06265379_101723 [Saccharicrinis carchari]